MLRRILFIGGLLAGLVISTLSVVLIWGEELERRAWAAAPSTLDFYTGSEVCTTANDEDGNEDTSNTQVLNCGHCGACSNVHDIRIYYETRSTLTETMTECARTNFLWGVDAYQCLQQALGLSDGCTHCWVLNYQCNMQNCKKTCIKHRMFPFLPSFKEWNSEPLDPCIACDEKLCGPMFVQCAGANRRRVGVISDLQRDHDLEICDKVDWEWILSPSSLSSSSLSIASTLDDETVVTNDDATTAHEL